MLTVWQYDGSLATASLETLDFHKVKWIDAKKPTQDELTRIATATGIAIEDIEQFHDSDERPALYEVNPYTAFIMQAPSKGKRWEHTASFLMFLSENLIVTIREKDSVIDEILAMPHDKLHTLFAKGTSAIALRIMLDVTNSYFTILDAAEDRINVIEDKVFQNPDKRTVQEIFSLKNTLVYVHKGLSGNREVLMKADTAVKLKLGAVDLRRLRFMYADTVQLIDVAATYRDILTGALDIYLSSVSNSLNNIVKQMTAWGSLVLIPTLIASIYGMNFKHMPELNWLLGYPFALFLMLGSATLLYIVFKRKRFI